MLGTGSLVEAAVYAGNAGERTAGMLLNLSATAPVALSRTLPRLAAVTVTASMVALLADVAPLTVSAVVGQLLVLYVLTVRGNLVVATLLSVPLLVNVIEPVGNDDTAPGVLLLAMAVGAEVLGHAHRQRGTALAERDASRLEMAATLRQQAMMEERARIAREMHDVVAHHVSMISVQADEARLTTPGMPEVGQARLQAIGETARDALSEMRQLLGVLRDDNVVGGERQPQPGLARLDELIDAVRDAGAHVRLTVSGSVVPLPPGPDLSAYRIIQEALTNARRHAPGADVDVELRYEPGALRVRVRDHGPGAAHGSTEHPHGHGIVGMHERASAVGGTFRAGPANDGHGYVVVADLPTSEPNP